MKQYFVIGAMPFGYGPASKAIAIAERLQSAGASCRFIGASVSLELASQSIAFDDILNAELAPQSIRPLIRGARHTICVMDEAFAATVLDENCSVSVVDSLFWMWDEIPQPYLSADHYFVQNFPGVPNRCAGLTKPPLLVGPIIGSCIQRPVPTRNIIINIGGYTSPHSTETHHSEYLMLVSDLVSRLLDSGDQLDSGLIRVVGGRDAIAALTQRKIDDRVLYDSLPARECRSYYSAASVVITSPGLTATLECFSSRVPTLFLPPQNYSQWLILASLRELDLAPCSTHWNEYSTNHDITTGMPEHAAVDLINGLIASLASRPDVRTAIGDTLCRGLRGDLTAMTNRQHQFFVQLGTNGAETIATTLLGRF